SMNRSAISRLLPAAGLLAVALAAAGDQHRGTAEWPTGELHFARMVYTDRGSYGFGRGYGSWTVDYPEAEYHFTEGVGRLTRVDVSRESRIIQLTDDSLFDYPWLYAVEVGRWYLDDVEAARLREYL